MGNNYEIVNPILIVISLGLVAYLMYLISLMMMGSAFRLIENVILILVIIAAVVIVVFVIKEQTRLHEKLNITRLRIEEIMKTERKERKKLKKKKKEKAKEEEREEEEGPEEEPERKEERKPGKKPEKKNEEEKPRKETKQAAPKIEKPEVDEEKLEEITRLLEEGTKLAGTDIEGAKKAFLKVRDIYDSLSPGERRSIDKQIVKIKGFREIARKSRKKKK
ncbi:MAG: hypothetical protein JSV39_01270 [Candidatus Aenigmatarchaeota archaeon]|nr:MAG: hypothetical protein JSV39_01270 [Candidatus Aenigmarchaeota archaeon]